VPVELAGVALPHLTKIGITEGTRLVRHAVPGMSGDLAQVLGRPSVDVELAGVLYGPAGVSDLDRIRQAHEAGDAVSLFIEPADDSEATQTLHFSDVLIAGLEVQQRAGAPDEFGFACRLVEYVPPPPPAAAGPLGGLGALDALDTDILADAMAAVDGVQAALEGVSKLADLLGAATSFADPTTRLPEMLNMFAPVATSATGLLGGLRDEFDAPA
jgi:hypothetical protein